MYIIVFNNFFMCMPKQRTRISGSCSFRALLYLICDSRQAEMEWHARHSAFTHFVWGLAKNAASTASDTKNKAARTYPGSAESDFHLSPSARYARIVCSSSCFGSRGVCCGNRISDRSEQSNRAAASFPTHWAVANGWQGISCHKYTNESMS